MLRVYKPEFEVPFFEQLGIKTTIVEEFWVEAEIVVQNELINRIGSMHSAVMIALAINAAQSLIGSNIQTNIYTPLIRNIKFENLSPILKKAIASAHIEESELEKLKKKLEQLGEAELNTSVIIKNLSGEICGRCEIQWFLKNFTPTTQ